MSAKTEKQKKFFGAATGAKKEESNVSGKAKKEIKKSLTPEDKEEDAESIAKQLKTTGKATIKGPNVKERKKFAPATKVESPKKGRGSYDRKNAFTEEVDIINFIDCILSKNYASANKYIKQAVETKLQQRIEKELSTPLF
jgi:hypothetical protein